MNSELKYSGPPTIIYVYRPKAVSTASYLIHWGCKFAHGSVLLVEGDRMVVCVACCCVGDQFGLLVREGASLQSSRFSSKWAMKPEIQWFALGDHIFKCAALWKTVNQNVIECIHWKWCVLAFSKTSLPHTAVSTAITPHATHAREWFGNTMLTNQKSKLKQTQINSNKLN